MNQYDVSDGFVKTIVENANWKDVGVNISESKDKVVEETKDEVVEETNTEIEHFCPLCESKLEEELSDEVLYEHIDTVLSLANDLLKEETEEEESSEEEK